MKVLHVAPLNVAGVPYSLMEMQRRFGAEVRLVTLHRNTFGFSEDICLDLPLPRNMFARWWRARKGERSQTDAGRVPDSVPLVHRPRNVFEQLYFQLDDRRRLPVVKSAINRFDLEEFDIIHYDGGLDFYRDSRLAKKWKREGKKIVCHYMGSDLRIRGIDPFMDSMSDLNLTNESDHLLRHPDIHYLYIPFDVSGLEMRSRENERLRIVHSPTNRAMKGTELIIPVIESVMKERDIEFVLLENRPHHEVVEVKRSCDLAIEQVGNYGGTGYGRNSLETLAMGIPTITEMTPDYVAWLPDNPFVLANPRTLRQRLLELIDDQSLRAEYRMKGRTWVETYHSYEAVHAHLMELYHAHHIV